MPVYEYRCLTCGKQFSKFISYQDYGSITVICTHCGSDDIQRKINRVRVARSDDSRVDQFPDTDMAGMENDPVSMGRMMRKMSDEMGEKLPEEFNEVVNRLEKGESPESIEKSMPDLGAGLDDV
jgi:putative FmdB family regulatory protein